MLQCVILSGGSGTRLWPLSRELFPKQLINLQGGDETLLQATLTRTEGLPGLLPPAIVCNENHRFLVAEQVRALGVSGAKVILEPCARNTAPAIALAALAANPEALLLVLPADHVIHDKAAFQAAVSAAIPVAQNGSLVTFGVVPSAAETGYGYIRCGKSLGKAFQIDSFIEKPDRKTAEDFLTSGGYLWNSGIFLFKSSRYLEELIEHAPAMLEAARAAVSAAKSDLDFLRVDAGAFAKCPSDSIDYAVMEKTKSAAVVPLDAGWSDVGSWSSLHEALARDAAGNALRGDVLSVDTQGSFVLAESRLVATVGLKDHVVVETKDAVLVAPKDRVQDVKKLVEKIKQDGRSEHQLHREVHRPWGSYDSIESGTRYQVKRLSVRPGASMSLQLHHHRAEHWIVVAGTARITRGEEVFILEENQSTYIPLGVKHRIENPGKIPLHIIEVQSGSYLGEDDIVRFEDRYGR
jgi:mannose-1-phosphate guanylyltransferase/mannose-6-phosphate isomerase